MTTVMGTAFRAAIRLARMNLARPRPPCLLVRESRLALLEKRRAFLRGVRCGLGDGNRPAFQLDCRLETAHALVEPQRLFRQPDAYRHIDPNRPGKLQRGCHQLLVRYG